ncbi:hypothetical protein CPB84DRAFT_1770713 [Gymnopilus junonius]|uniref:Zn(2)-C6 fungal-type domain-containing protein n=1 Tax=Gymnopilus junonius TaxID=109634 RepID=A0A9P5TRM8_GYMJU|nr:hypothetical protein CPB84DRAFT_1770713 [Gymnopilus junonius]
MSPRGSSIATPPGQSARSSSAPYSRRSASQPKSSRQQFSACGACRMRRVRCDLKDLPIGFVGPHPACSNCKERGIKCVDEFADVKAVKLLRRGRRLQQVEAIYGKVGDQESNLPPANLSPRPSIIPTLHPDFFISPFWSWFSIQRPILDASDFATKFTAHCKNGEPLGNEAKLISMVLVAWAASFGFNERGFPNNEFPLDDRVSPGESHDSPAPHLSSNRKYISLGNMRQQWKTTAESFIHEILDLVDSNGVLRRPTLDGVRLLLLLLPLLEDAQPLERLAIYEATLSQVQALCIVSASSSSNFEDASMRARIFWYAYSQESMLTGIRGGRFVLNAEDFDTFQRTLPPSHVDLGAALPSPPSPSSVDVVPNMFPYHVGGTSHVGAQGATSHKNFIDLMRASSPPLELGNVCRRIHDVVTGIKATRRAENHGLIDANGLRDIWRSLDRCWQDLDLIKCPRQEHEEDPRRYEITQYASAWQIFIFECHNVIRESLKHFASSSAPQVVYDPSSPSRPSSHSSNSSPYLPPQPLHSTATRKCLALLPCVLHILRAYVSRDRNDVPGIIRYDAGLVRDGCFFAAYLAANLDGEFIDGSCEDDKPNNVDTLLTVDEGVSICLTVLASMRWSFSKSEEREGTIKMIWENRKLRRQGQAHHLPLYDSDYPQPLALSVPHLGLNLSQSPHSGMTITGSEDRPMLPPLSLFKLQRSTESAPNTACSTDDHGTNSWPSYTPPGTATSATTSASTGRSGRGSPVFTNINTFKAMDDVFYHGGTEVDQFTYSVPLSVNIIRGNSAIVPNPPYGGRTSHLESQTLATTTPTSYMVNTSFHDTNSSILTQADMPSVW